MLSIRAGLLNIRGMTPPPVQPLITQTVVARRRTLCREHFEVTLRVNTFPAAAPGQFVQILCHDPDPFSTANSDPARKAGAGEMNPDLLGESPLLRRPFSIGGMRATTVGVEIDIMGRVVGVGTRWLDGLAPGDVVEILGPLGRSFSTPPTGHRALLIAGGVGLPPIRWLGERLRAENFDCRAIFGAQSRDLLPLVISQSPVESAKFSMIADEFSRDGIAQIITTDDGTFGLRGRVTDALKPALATDPDLKSLRVYACGPEPMLEAVARLCDAAGVTCELALERVMGCGVGTCQSCVVPVSDAAADDGWRYALCCREGPVFESTRLIWSTPGAGQPQG